MLKEWGGVGALVLCALLLQACGTTGGSSGKKSVQMSEAKVNEALQAGKAVVITRQLLRADNTWRRVDAPDDASGYLDLPSDNYVKDAELIGQGKFHIAVVEPGKYAYNSMQGHQDLPPMQFQPTQTTNLLSPLGAVQYLNTSRTIQEAYTVQEWQPAQGVYQYVNPTGHPGTQAIPIWTQTQAAGYVNVTRYRPKDISVVRTTVLFAVMDEQKRAYFAEFNVKAGEIIFLDVVTFNTIEPDNTRCKPLDNRSWGCPLQILGLSRMPYQNLQKELKESIQGNGWSEALTNRIVGRNVTLGRYLPATPTLYTPEGAEIYTVNADTLNAAQKKISPSSQTPRKTIKPARK